MSREKVEKVVKGCEGQVVVMIVGYSATSFGYLSQERFKMFVGSVRGPSGDLASCTAACLILPRQRDVEKKREELAWLWL